MWIVFNLTTIHDSYSSNTIFESLSLSILNIGGIWGFVMILGSLCNKITHLTCRIHRRKLFSCSLMDIFGANVLPKLVCGIVCEDLVTSCISWSTMSWSAMEASLKLVGGDSKLIHMNDVQSRTKWIWVCKRNLVP